MSYTSVLNLINTNLASATDITAAEHREVEIALLNYSKNQNNYIGYVRFTPGVPESIVVGGEIISAVPEDAVTMLCTMANAMPSINYIIKISPESLGTSFNDQEFLMPLFRKVSTTQFLLVTGGVADRPADVKWHFEITSLD